MPGWRLSIPTIGDPFLARLESLQGLARRQVPGLTTNVCLVPIGGQRARTAGIQNARQEGADDGAERRGHKVLVNKDGRDPALHSSEWLDPASQLATSALAVSLRLI